MLDGLELAFREYETARVAVDAARHRMRQARQALIAEVEKLRVGLGSNVTRRQAEVFELILDGRSNKEIAGELGITERTVKFHVSELLLQFDAPDRHALAQKYFKGIEQ
jgi:DNA-binding NarL/FixJ family response regulator